MTDRIHLSVPHRVLEKVWDHLLPDRADSEEAAFIFVRREDMEGRIAFRCVDWYPVPLDGFVIHSRYHIELTDETRAKVIKRAHDLGASLVEFHSHMGSALAKFSPSDLAGFNEFVPHAWWRLKGRPYIALVVSKSSFDALVWLSDPNLPQRLDGLVVGETLLVPTQLSSLTLEYEYD